MRPCGFTGGPVWLTPCLLSRAEHRELCAAFEKHARAGSKPAAAWRKAMAGLTPTWVLSVMLEIDRRRLRLGLSAHEICEKAGLAQRGYFKWLTPWVRGTGRVPSWGTLQTLALTVSGEGVESLVAKVRGWPHDCAASTRRGLRTRTPAPARPADAAPAASSSSACAS